LFALSSSPVADRHTLFRDFLLLRNMLVRDFIDIMVLLYLGTSLLHIFNPLLLDSE